MRNLITLLLLAAILGIVLISCANNATAESNLMPQVQPTADLSSQVSIELTSRYDTAAQYNTVGQVVRITYTIRMLKNDLNDTIQPNISFTGAAPVACPAVNTVGNLNDRFDTGEAIDCTYDYPLTQTDLDRGSISNAVTVTVYTVTSSLVTTTVPTVQSKILSLTVSANPTTYSQSGQSITFTYTLKNDGVAQIGPAQLSVTDTLISQTPFNCGNPDATIAPGATLTCTSTYSISAADLEKTSISNNAIASGGNAKPSSAVSVAITKSGTSSGVTLQHTVQKGEWLWQIARCYGADPAQTVAANSQLPDASELTPGVVVTVPNAGSKGAVHKPPEPCVTLYTVKSGDTWGSIASAHGADPGFTQYVNENVFSVGSVIKVPHYTAGMNFQVPSSSTPTTTSLTLTVTANLTTYGSVGQTITFTYLIRNSGSTTLGPTQFTINDSLLSATPFNCGVADTTLAPNATVTCSANYTVTQADMEKSSIANNATASGGGAGPSQPDSETVTRSVSTLNLSVVPVPSTYSQVGQLITITYIITNGGTTDIGPTQFTITDTLVGASPFNCGSSNTTLVVNGNVTCSTNYTITEANMGQASISTNAIAAGGGVPASAPVVKPITKQ